MTDGRRTQVVLLDERRLEFLVQSKLFSGDLLDLVASHCNLKEKEFFGLAFTDETGHNNWLQHDRRVLEHEFPKKSGLLGLSFKVRYFVESITILRDTITIELFFLQAKQAIFKGDLEVDSETAFELAAHILQALHGDFTSDYAAKNNLKKLPVLPTSALKDHPSLSYCEDRVLYYYRRLAGQNRGQAIVNYMSIIESLPTYGVHYYEVKDKSGLPWWLGFSHKGIGQYDITDKVTPRKVFQWRQLENLYFRDRKFSIEVHDPRRVSLSRRTFGPSNVTVHAWYGNPVLVKSMWAMAISQHQFYLDRKQSKASLPSFRSLGEIADELTESRLSLTSKSSQASDLTHDSSSISLSAISNGVSSEILATQQAAQREMILALKSRKEALEERLKLKVDCLKELCIKEAEIIGELPQEYPLVPGEPLPQVRRRVGTGFQLSDKLVNKQFDSHDDELHMLEVECELQSKITSAALSLANDPRINKKARKSRKETYKKAAEKLTELEKKLHNVKLQLGYSSSFVPVRLMNFQDDESSLSDSVSENSQPIFIGPPQTPPISRKSSDGSIRIIRSPHVEVIELQRTPSSRSTSTNRSRSPASERNVRKPISSQYLYFDKSVRRSMSDRHKPPSRMPGHRSRERTPAKWRSKTPEPPKMRPTIVDSMENLDQQPPRPTTPVILYPEREHADHRNYQELPEPPQRQQHTAVFTFQESTPKRPSHFETSSQRSDSPCSNRQRHASSTSNLSSSGKNGRDFLPFDNPEYHQQPTSLSQPASPRKHVSLGTLQNKCNSLPMGEAEDDNLGYTPYVSRTKYRSQHYPTYSTNSRFSDFSPKQFDFDDVNVYINQPYRHPDDDNSSSTSSSKQGSLDDRTHCVEMYRHDNDEPAKALSRVAKSMELLRDATLSIPNSRVSVDSVRTQESDETTPMQNLVRGTKSMENNLQRSSSSSDSSSCGGGGGGYITSVSHNPRAPLQQQYVASSSSQTSYEPTPVRPYYGTSKSPGYSRRAMNTSYRSVPSSPAHHRNTRTNVGITPAASLKPAEFHTATSTSVRPAPSYTVKVASKTHYQPVQPMTCEAVPKPGNPNRLYSESYTIENYQGDAGESLAEAFSEEMLAWYEENEQSFTSKTSNSTYV
uniref:FERM domain-containing protein 4A-like n=1 Tax=Saccoglossus kowalevskii TaxID=10224 RepID=A0ABM0N0B7_SACKO|nr:PREDICTED: FERM domain-containing protein 4A-like [Saccoglossus kowalevskii]